jgi:hypothetical protein
MPETGRSWGCYSRRAPVGTNCRSGDENTMSRPHGGVAAVDEPVRHVARHGDEVAGAQHGRLVTERVLHLALEDEDDLFAVRVHVLGVALPGVERGEPDRLLGARRVALADGPLHAAEVGGLGGGADVAAHLAVDRRHVH